MNKAYERTAQYHETDQMGIIHHANFIKWFEEARVWLMEEIGYSYGKLESRRIFSPVLNVYCEYKSMVRFGDTLLVEPRLASFNGVKMAITYTVVLKKTGELKAAGKTEHCFVDGNGKILSLKRHDMEIYNIFAGLLKEA